MAKHRTTKGAKLEKCFKHANKVYRRTKSEFAAESALKNCVGTRALHGYSRKRKSRKGGR